MECGVEKKNVRHIGIIMDGNGRWARAKGLPRSMGHRAGATAVRRTVEAAKKHGIEYLTLYSFSSENWRRSAEEIEELMNLLRSYLKHETIMLMKENIRLAVIGDRTRLSPDIVELIENAEKTTMENKALTLVLAINYGGRQEIAAAAKKIASLVKTGEISADAIDDKMFCNFLDTVNMPDPDFIIRTSGEQRLSNFLLWQSAYSEYIFSEVLWPDFKEENLLEALEEFSQRERRYGTIRS